MKIGKKVFPLGPSSISKKENNRNTTISLINEKEINRRMPSGLRDYTIDFIIPGNKYPFAYYPGGRFVDSAVYINYLRDLKKEKKIIRVIITRKQGKNKRKYHFVSTCTIEDFTDAEMAENGLDREVTLNIKAYRHYGTKKVKIKRTPSGKSKKTTKKSRKPSTKTGKSTTYTVKKGDTLRGIAKKRLGSYSRWREIYKLNKKKIEAVAKKKGKKSSQNGKWIFPGTKLRIPKK